MTTKTPDKIKKLVELFDRHIDQYKSHAYNETELRVEFVNPFWKALGWDVDNEQGRSIAYRDVIHEDAIKIGGATKAPDYCFRIGGTRKFFLETKRPSLNIKKDPSPAYQLRRYAWNKKLPLSVLTDFEEMAIYDCRIRPKKNDKASKARIRYFTYTNYLDKWDEIENIFSRESVLKGYFDNYVETTNGKRGTSEVDDEFLKEIEGWRDSLARNIALHNPKLGVRQLNFTVQRTIDRLIFLRLCEDRGIEPYEQLRALIAGQHIYKRMVEIYRKADQKYNSGLFYFQEERGREGEPDELTPYIKVDDKILKEIISGIYYPDCDYEFSILPPEILGNVYEQFLGKVIRLTAGHRAKVEEKPEVRKAGGVYYTPQYIVNYIVQQTVGKLCEDKKPKEISKLRVLDPACGSGSFLLGAFRYLMDYHLEWYINEMEKTGKVPLSPPPLSQPKRGEKQKRRKIPQAIYRGIGDEWSLTTAEKKRILLNNIHGVDIDSQAVEVTKLSLLLKVLENENQDTLQSQLTLWRERALPDLSNNIKCGNSLIGPDFYYQENQSTFFEDEETQYRINAFDWHDKKLGFGLIMEQGGFDAVIGNPPYIRIQAMKEWAPIEVEIFKKVYKSASKGSYDIYVVFVERGKWLLNSDGRLGFILPSKFLTTDYGFHLRGILSDSRIVDKIVDFGHEQVFNKSTTYTCLLFLDKSAPKQIELIRTHPKSLTNEPGKPKHITSTSLGTDPWILLPEKVSSVTRKINRTGTHLKQITASISRGSSTGADDVFCLKKEGNKLKTSDGEVVEIESGIFRLPLYATDYGRYMFCCQGNERVIFPYKVFENRYEVMEENTIINKFPKAYKYLSECKKRLTNRKQFRNWYEFSAPRSLHVHEAAHILVPLLADQGRFTTLPKHKKNYCMMASGGFSVKIDLLNYTLNPLFVLGLLNSKMLFWNLRLISNKFRGGWITCTKQYLGKLSICSIDFSIKDEVKKHDHIITLVESMLSLNKKLMSAKTPNEKTRLERQISATDKQIDKLVYQLYGLTEEEIKIVESSIQ